MEELVATEMNEFKSVRYIDLLFLRPMQVWMSRNNFIMCCNEK